MIGYSPIDFDDPLPIQRERQKEPERVKYKKIEPTVSDENTECNFVVMFFIVGVIALAAMDAIRR